MADREEKLGPSDTDTWPRWENVRCPQNFFFRLGILNSRVSEDEQSEQDGVLTKQLLDIDRELVIDIFDCDELCIRKFMACISVR